MEEFQEIKTLEKLEEQLAVRYKMVFPWRIDPVAVFDEAKARAFSERNTQSEQELRQMGKLRRLRRQYVMKAKTISTAERVGFIGFFLQSKLMSTNRCRSCERSTMAYVLGRDVYVWDSHSLLGA